MLTFFISLLISILLSFGISIALVEKGNEFPVKFWRINLQNIIHKISPKMSQVLYCTVCTSFWAALIADIVLCVLNAVCYGTFYFFWPFSGFIALGITWFIIEFLNSRDS